MKESGVEMSSRVIYQDRKRLSVLSGYSHEACGNIPRVYLRATYTPPKHTNFE